MNNKIIIHIDGVQGSGKSFICSKIKKFLCIDTDNIMNRAIKIIEDSQNTNKQYPKTINQLKKIEKKIINQYITNNDKILFVGMTVNIPMATHKFFIKINNPFIVYKRLLLRELDKIVLNYKKIKKTYH
jgi:cytidylate kinase